MKMIVCCLFKTYSLYKKAQQNAHYAVLCLLRLAIVKPKSNYMTFPDTSSYI